MTLPHDKHPLDIGDRPQAHLLDARDCGHDEPGDAPVPEVGVIRLLSPAPTLYVALRHARLIEAWDGRFARWLEPRHVPLHGYAACAILERELGSAIELREHAFDAQVARTMSLAYEMCKLLTASADLSGHRRVLTGFQRAMHDAPQPWHLLDAIRDELAPWHAYLRAREQLLVGRLAENFSFLHGAIELRASHGDDGTLFVDVVYARPDAALPSPDATPEPWLSRGFVEALQCGPCVRPRLVRETWEIMGRRHTESARHG